MQASLNDEIQSTAEDTPLLTEAQSTPSFSPETKKTLSGLWKNLAVAPISGSLAGVFNYTISQELNNSEQFAIAVTAAFATQSLNKALFTILSSKKNCNSLLLKTIEGIFNVLLPNAAMFGVRQFTPPSLALNENLEMMGIFVLLMATTECARKVAEYATHSVEKREANGTSANLLTNFIGSVIAGLGKGLADEKVAEVLKKFSISGYGFGVGILTQTLGPQLLKAAGRKINNCVSVFRKHAEGTEEAKSQAPSESSNSV